MSRKTNYSQTHFMKLKKKTKNKETKDEMREWLVFTVTHNVLWNKANTQQDTASKCKSNHEWIKADLQQLCDSKLAAALIPDELRSE